MSREYCPRPTLHVLTGDLRNPHVDLRTLRAKQHRVSRALLKAQRLVDDALRKYQVARDLAAEERAPVNAHTHDRIVESLVSADCLLRTEIALRSREDLRNRADLGHPLESDPDAVDEET